MRYRIQSKENTHLITRCLLQFYWHVPELSANSLNEHLISNQNFTRRLLPCCSILINFYYYRVIIYNLKPCINMMSCYTSYHSKYNIVNEVLVCLLSMASYVACIRNLLKLVQITSLY